MHLQTASAQKEIYMKALVTGASGFIGSSLVEELTSQGWEVRALLRHSSRLDNLANQRFERAEGSLGDKKSLERAVQGVDFVFHLAGSVRARTQEEFYKANAQGTRNLAEAVSQRKGNPLSRFVYVSSLAAGGPQEEFDLRVESYPDVPVSDYGASKLQGEKELLIFKDKFPISILRPPMVYGPRDKDVFIFVKSVNRNLVPLLKPSSSSANKHYSVIHVKDLCRAIYQAALASEVPSGEVFYVSEDQTYTMEEIYATIAQALNRKPIHLRLSPSLLKGVTSLLMLAQRFTGKTFALNSDKLNEILADYWICSNQKAKVQLNFEPEFDFRSGMKNTVQWYQQEHWI